MSESTTGSHLASTFQMSCPSCHTGKMFETGSFSFKNPFEMHTRCPVCNQNYYPEPGFYYGAMFVSYILSVLFGVAFMLLTHFLLGWSFDLAFGVFLGVVAVLFVWIFRISRSLWLHFNVKFNPATHSKKGDEGAQN